MRKIYRKIQFLSNIATVIIAVLLCVITVKLFFPGSPSNNLAEAPKTNPVTANSNPRSLTNPAQENPVGKSIPLENIDWKENKKTLVLYLSTTCRFCNESGSFYKRLVEKYSNDKNVRLVAVLPQSVDEAKKHLTNLGVNINDVRNARLTSIGVSATPTLLLVNESGVISGYWRGKLTEDKESEVFTKLAS